MNSDDGHPFSNFDVNNDKHHFLTLNHHSTASLQRCFGTYSPEPSTTTFPAGRGIDSPDSPEPAPQRPRPDSPAPAHPVAAAPDMVPAIAAAVKILAPPGHLPRPVSPEPAPLAPSPGSSRLGHLRR